MTFSLCGVSPWTRLKHCSLTTPALQAPISSLPPAWVPRQQTFLRHRYKRSCYAVCINQLSANDCKGTLRGSPMSSVRVMPHFPWAKCSFSLFLIACSGARNEGSLVLSCTMCVCLTLSSPSGPRPSTPDPHPRPSLHSTGPLLPTPHPSQPAICPLLFICPLILKGSCRRGPRDFFVKRGAGARGGRQVGSQGRGAVSEVWGSGGHGQGLLSEGEG